MGKTEFPKKWLEPKAALEPKGEPRGGGTGAGSSKSAWISNKIFDIIKLVLGICLLPFVYSSTISFLSQVSNIGISLQNYFWSGTVTLLIVYLFAWEPAVIYEKGHKLLEIIFSFFQPLVKVAPYLLPIYTIIIFILYLFFSIFFQGQWFTEYAMFLFGFSTALHLVFAAKSIRSKKGDILKSNYIFGFSFMYIINLGLISLFFSFLFREYSLVCYCNETYSTASSIFKAVFSQLFMVKP
ncbi:MAG: hypothetical protein PHY88_00410 [Candidatus Omnitrophica bacterium]|nr:hypothetical protein [Candidatus Omnitrophota bacterium]